MLFSFASQAKNICLLLSQKAAQGGRFLEPLTIQSLTTMDTLHFNSCTAIKKIPCALKKKKIRRVRGTIIKILSEKSCE